MLYPSINCAESNNRSCKKGYWFDTAPTSMTISTENICIESALCGPNALHPSSVLWAIMWRNSVWWAITWHQYALWVTMWYQFELHVVLPSALRAWRIAQHGCPMSLLLPVWSWRISFTECPGSVLWVPAFILKPAQENRTETRMAE